MKIPNRITLYVKKECDYDNVSSWKIVEYMHDDIKSIEKQKYGVIRLEIYGLDQNYHQGGWDDGFVEGFLTEQDFWKYDLIDTEKTYKEECKTLLKTHKENLKYIQKKLKETK